MLKELQVTYLSQKYLFYTSPYFPKEQDLIISIPVMTGFLLFDFFFNIFTLELQEYFSKTRAHVIIIVIVDQSSPSLSIWDISGTEIFTSVFCFHLILIALCGWVFLVLFLWEKTEIKKVIIKSPNLLEVDTGKPYLSRATFSSHLLPC